jgi:hypothetical protein
MMAQRKVQDTLLQSLEDALVNRSVQVGFALLDKTLGKTELLDPKHPDAISLLLCIAQWVDLGYRNIAFLDSFQQEFSQINLAQLPLLDFLKLRLVHGFRCMASEDLDRAISLFDLTLRAGDDLMPPYLIFLTIFGWAELTE